MAIFAGLARPAGDSVYTLAMCRNIKTLFNFEPPATPEEVRAAALQFVRKVSGMTKPAQANSERFEQAVDEITAVTERLLADLTTTSPAKDREAEAEKARKRWQKRAERIRTET